ncbi:MAG: fimbrial biogenesis chaperone [Myxococcales bacterium]
MRFAFALLLVAGAVHAAGLNVSPVQVRLTPEESKALVTLRNDGQAETRFQVTAMAWDEDAARGMVLAATQEVVFFPALFALKAGESRNVRVGVTVPFGPVERTYRIFIEELPPPEKPSSTSSVRVLTRVGIPVFVAPVKTLHEVKLSELSLSGGRASVDVRNAGNEHFRVDTVRVEGHAQGGAKVFERQASGWYVLAGGHKRYELELPREECARVRRLVVSVKTDREEIYQQALDAPAGACGG